MWVYQYSFTLLSTLVSLSLLGQSPALYYSTSIDIHSASLSGESFSVNAQDANPYDIAFSNDGITMFVVGNGNDAILVYNLTVPFLISSATYSLSFSVAAQETLPRGLDFSANGSRMYVTGTDSDNVIQYDLSNSFDLSGAVASGTISISSQDGAPIGIDFSSNGANMYVLGANFGEIHQYNLTTAFDVTTANLISSFSLVAESTGPKAFEFNVDGTRMFVLGSNGLAIYEYRLAFPFELNSAGFERSLSVTPAGAVPVGLAFSIDGTRLYVADLDSDLITEFALTSFAFKEAQENDGSIEGSMSVLILDESFNNAGSTLTSPEHFTIPNLPSGLIPSFSVSANGQIATLTFSGVAAMNQDDDDVTDLAFLFSDQAFTNSSAAEVVNATGPAESGLGINFRDNPIPTLYYSTAIDLSSAVFADKLLSIGPQHAFPRALTFSNDGTRLFVIGSDNDNISEYDLGEPFVVVSGVFSRSLYIGTDQPEPKDLTFNSDGSKMYVLGDVGDEINSYLLSESYNIVSASYSSSFSVPSDSRAMEFNNNGSKLFVLTTSGDELHSYSLGTPFDLSSAVATNTLSIGAEDTNPLGIAFNSDGKRMFILGGAGDVVLAYDLADPFDTSTATPVGTFSVASEEVTPMDIAFSNDGTKMFVLGLIGLSVGEYSLSDKAFTEQADDDGSVEGSLIISISGDTFVSTLTTPTHLLMPNLPDGLSPIFDVSDDRLTATVTLNGNAIDHADDNDVDNLEFNFEDDSFANSNAIEVANATGPAESRLGMDFFGGQVTSITVQGSKAPKVFPNPTRGDITLQIQNKWSGRELYLAINNSSGQMLWTATAVPNNFGRIKVDLSDLPKGTYYLSILFENETTTHTISKK